MAVTEIANIIDLVGAYLNPEEMYHALRTAKFALDEVNFYTPSKEEFQLKVYTTALLYHVLDKISMTFGAIDELLNENEEVSLAVVEALNILHSQSKDEDDEEYIKHIVDSGNKIAIIVKKADLKDHLLDDDKFTNESKEKYINLVRYLI